MPELGRLCLRRLTWPGFATVPAGCPAGTPRLRTAIGKMPSHRGGDPAKSVRSAAHSTRNRRLPLPLQRNSLSTRSSHRLAAPLAPSAINSATTDTCDRSIGGSKSEAASCTQRPSGPCQYVPRRPARTSWKSLPQYGRLMSCVIRFIFAALRVAHISSRIFHGAGNEKPGGVDRPPGHRGKGDCVTSALPRRRSGHAVAS